MRTIMYAIFNKTTNMRVYTNWNHSKCVEVMNELDNKEEYEIRYKWFSF